MVTMASKQSVVASLSLAVAVVFATFSHGRIGTTFFLAPPTVGLPALDKGTGAGARRSATLIADGSTSAGAASLTATAATLIAAVAALSGARRGAAARRDRLSQTRRQVIYGHRMYEGYVHNYPGMKDVVPLPKNYLPGEVGYSMKTAPAKPLPPPARQSLSRVEEPLATFMTSDFYKVPFAKVSEVKKVGTCTFDKGEITSPASNIPEYKMPKVGTRMEKERGAMRTPLEDDEYEAYIAKRSMLTTMAEKAVGSLSKDFLVDRSALTVLLDYVNESLTPSLKMKGQTQNPVDLVKVTKEGKNIVLERLFERKNLWAGRRSYRGGWKRSEVSNNGTFMPAWERLATGDTEKQCMMVTGLRQIAGTRAGLAPAHYQFVEYSVGDASFTTRVRTDAQSDGKSVELKHKNWYYRQQLTMLDAYYELTLGGIDKIILGLHRSGKVIRIVELTVESLLEKEPGLAAAAERRFGRLVSLLGKMKESVDKAGDGSYVLQWQNGALVLGKYEKVEPEEEEEEEVEEIAVEA